MQRLVLWRKLRGVFSCHQEWKERTSDQLLTVYGRKESAKRRPQLRVLMPDQIAVMWGIGGAAVQEGIGGPC